MSLDASTFFAIVAMMVATVSTRMGGLLLVRYTNPGPRMKKALSSVPPAVLMAVVTPTALSTGTAESIACLVTAIAALRLSLLPAAFTGVATAAVLRSLGF